MSQIISRINAFLTPYKRKIFIGLFLLVLLFIAKYAWTNYGLLDSKNKFKDVANTNKNVGRIDIYYFYADWCPHCKNSRLEWDKFKQEYQKINKALKTSYDGEKKLIKKCKELISSIFEKASNYRAALRMANNEVEKIASLKQEVSKSYEEVQKHREEEEKYRETIGKIKVDINNLKRK